jgi:hypothetical protein
MNKEYIIKCALAFSLTKDNDDSRDDSFARLMVLHVFDLDMRDVAHTLKQQNEIYWDDTRIPRSNRTARKRPETAINRRKMAVIRRRSDYRNGRPGLLNRC